MRAMEDGADLFTVPCSAPPKPADGAKNFWDFRRYREKRVRKLGPVRRFGRKTSEV